MLSPNAKSLELGKGVGVLCRRSSIAGFDVEGACVPSEGKVLLRDVRGAGTGGGILAGAAAGAATGAGNVENRLEATSIC